MHLVQQADFLGDSDALISHMLYNRNVLTFKLCFNFKHNNPVGKKGHSQTI